MSEPLGIVVHGLPAPQGSKRAYVNKHTGRVNVVESSKAVKPWRESVKAAALLGGVTFTGPLRVILTFVLPRPKGHYGTGRNSGTVKASAPAFPAVRPDLDKLIRSTLDALRDAGVYRDDAQIVRIRASKHYPGWVGAMAAGAVIELEEIWIEGFDE